MNGQSFYNVYRYKTGISTCAHFPHNLYCDAPSHQHHHHDKRHHEKHEGKIKRVELKTMLKQNVDT